MLTIAYYSYFPKHSNQYNHIQHEYGNVLNSLYKPHIQHHATIQISSSYVVSIFEGEKSMNKETQRLNSDLLTNSTFNDWPPTPFQGPLTAKERNLA